MIETFKEMKHGKSSSYENLALERTASQILHHMEDKDSEDSLESTRARVLANARAIYGANRSLDVISFAPTSSRKIGAAIVEHNLTSRSYVHCSSAKEDSRLAAVEHLLVITEDLLQRLMDAEGITSSGWLPATPQSQHAATFSIASVTGSVAGSKPASRRSSVAPLDLMSDRPIDHNPQHPHHHLINDHNSPHSPHHIQKPQFLRGNSDASYPMTTPQPPVQLIPRTSSDVIQQPKPVPIGQFQGNRQGRMQWKLGSDS
ncbi:uncharacterized protein K460DRAFT_341359 [Cucurbitaria berberidis CBS 394.84]|uniref:Uncharacterized protein n=1 Tax=Cucurbitaria berberidis CBS 394.84 TaxID=1168544 RepID=A0A9P4GDE5_9PLEO|nr:uncharacterized protein K460DRAFT_341359 [Cucurbitaria berberidis CBS 394.84]KAF1843342.1 hypothetical protein K460DRAFT_341359 [Cucurbitaria berberidis CBS 394.84]